MPTIKTSDGINLYYEEVGRGTPIIFVHEFAGDYRSWENQMRFFSRNHRCITFSARGYPPSDVPQSADSYSQRRAVDDVAELLNALNIEKSHVVGLSMGGFATLHFGLHYSHKALSLVIAGAGYGAEKQHAAHFKDLSLEVANQFEKQGSKEFAKTYSTGASRVQFQNKDPRGWQQFADMLGQHSSQGSANTMRGVQAKRPSIYDLEENLKNMTVPTLIMVGDEDDHCLQPGIFMKKIIPASGLLIFPKTGHTLNLEEPHYFNRFVADFICSVEAGTWLPRDPNANSQEIMKTS
jgi:pimeloyl-ACP methyl ester carboxylesterase